MTRLLLLIACALMLGTACGGRQIRKTSGSATASASATTTPNAPTPYQIPPIPAMMTDPEQRVEWAVQHYWDAFNFTDTLGVAGWSLYAEQAFVDFDYQLLMNIPAEQAGEAITVLFDRAAVNKDVFLKFAEISEKYLYDPNSPILNEELYIPVLNAVLANPALDEWEKVRPGEQLRLALKNRVGNPAADFRYTLESGASGSLYALKAAYTMLFFNNPGCPACRETMSQIMASPMLRGMIEAGTLRVLAVYPDADLAAWREYLPSMPDGWINSYDAPGRIKNEELYDLKAIPTVYLLDSAKRVMLKDVTSVPLIEQTIAQAQQ